MLATAGAPGMRKQIAKRGHLHGSASLMAKVGSALLVRRCEAFSSEVSRSLCELLVGLLFLSEWKLNDRDFFCAGGRWDEEGPACGGCCC